MPLGESVLDISVPFLVGWLFGVAVALGPGHGD
jgi:hypothetical protein